MEELVIQFKTHKTLNIAIGVPALICGIGVVAIKVINKEYNITLISGLLNLIIGSICIIRYINGNIPTLKINNESIESNLPYEKKTSINWIDVSKVNIGVSHINFLLNGEQKEQKLNLSGLIYNDLKNVKSKIIELCEHKNISYNND